MRIKFEEIAPLSMKGHNSVKNYLVQQLECLLFLPHGEFISITAIAAKLCTTVEGLFKQLQGAFEKIRNLERNLRMIEGRNYPCPNCGTKTVEPDINGMVKGKCVVCLMEFSLPLLDDLRRNGNVDLGITERIESLRKENRCLNERLRRLQQYIHNLGVCVPPEWCSTSIEEGPTWK